MHSSRWHAQTMSPSTFEAVSQLLATLDVDKTWKTATDVERRVLIDEFIEEITVLPDYLDVKVQGAPSLHVRYQEVGMKESGLIVSEGGSESIPWASLMPSRLGEHPTSERESVAIRYARSEPPLFGHRRRNSSVQAHATDQNPYLSRR